MTTSFRILLVATVATALSLVAAESAACDCNDCPNCPGDGGVQKPAGFDIRLPFRDGENVNVLSGYGPYAGSGLHCRTRDSVCANDWYAFDFTLPDHGNYGYGQDVVAVASGTVLHADWGTDGWQNYGRRVYILHDFDDGHSYVSVYAHLSQIEVSADDHVSQGDKIGELGGSCSLQDSCPSFSIPHLHFALHRDALYGGTGSGGSYGGRALIPEPIDGYSGVEQEDLLVAGNGGPVTPECNIVIGDEPVVIEEDGPCASLAMDSPLTDTTGHGDHAYWTALDEPAPDYAQGVFWHLNFAQAGDYQLWAYVPSGVSDLSARAMVKIRHGGEESWAYPDQSANQDSWVHLAELSFAAGEDQWVRLGDNFDEPSSEGKNVVFDALRIAPTTGCECTDPNLTETEACVDGGVHTRSCDGCGWTDWSACGSEAPDGGTSTCTPGQTQQEPCAAGGTRERRCDADGTWGDWSECSGGVGGTDDDGCGCRLPRQREGWAGAALAGLLLLVLAQLRRGRCRRA